MRLGVKFAIAFFISSIASISFISLLSYTLARNALQGTIVTQQQELTRQTMGTIDQVLAQRLAAVHAIAQNDTVLSFIQSRNAGNQSDAQLLEKVKNTLQTLLPVTGSWADMDIVNTNGEILYSQIPQWLGKPISKEGLSVWFSQALQGKTVYSDVIHDPENNNQSVIFASPVIDKTTPSHPVLGVLFGHMSWNDVISVMQSLKEYNVELYNQKGLLIGNNQKIQEAQSFLVQTPFSSTISKFGKANGNSTEVSSKELVSVASETGFGSFKGNGWMLAIRTPIKIAFAPAVNAAIVIAGLLLPVIIVVNAILLIFILELLRPILLIGQVAEEIAKGNLTKRVPHTGNDEIGWLADSFNRMADTLQELYEGLERKVQEKTKELSEKMEDAEAMNSFMIKRELKLIELKKQIAELKQQLSEKKS